MINLILKMTNGCNLNCSYCFDSMERSKEISFLKEEDILKFVDLFKKEEISLTFHGGEPTLINIEFYEKLIIKLNTKYKNIKHYNLQTNGVLLNDELLSRFLKLKIKLGISFDLINENEHRCDKKNINENIKKILKKEDIGSINVFKLNETNKLYNTLIKNKDCKISYNNEFIVNKTKEEVDYYINEYIEYFKKAIFIKDIEIERSVLEFISSILNCKNVCSFSKCLNSFFILNIDNTISTCDRFSSIVTENILGKIDDFKDYKDILNSENFSRILNEDFDFYYNNCNNCEIKEFCQGICLANRYFENNKINKKNELDCYAKKEIIKNIFNILFELKENELLELNDKIYIMLFENKFIFEFLTK